MPSRVRELRGETRPSQLRPVQPMPGLGDPPTMPRWFTSRHVEVWQAITAELDGMRMLHSCDREVLVVLVAAVVRHETAARAVAAEGVMVEGEDGRRVRNPAVIVEHQAAEQVRRLAREFGLTPSARADLGSPRAAPSDRDPERLFTTPPM